MDVKSICKECGGTASADQFKLHYIYKKMVCPSCFVGRTEEKRRKDNQEKVEAKPSGWDKEDEYLEKITRARKQEEQVAQFSKIPGTTQLQCKCLQCKYVFKYDPFRKMPRACPYCNYNVPKLTTYNLL